MRDYPDERIHMRCHDVLYSACENVLTGHQHIAGVGSDVGRTKYWQLGPIARRRPGNWTAGGYVQ
jgi:hypothetical protein